MLDRVHHDLGIRDGFEITVDVFPDLVSEPDPQEWDEEDLTTWKRGEWHFIGIVVTASRSGIAMGTAAEWGLPHPGNDDYDTLRRAWGPNLRLLLENATIYAKNTLRRLNS